MHSRNNKPIFFCYSVGNWLWQKFCGFFLAGHKTQRNASSSLKLTFLLKWRCYEIGSRTNYTARRVVAPCDLCLVFKRFPQFLLNIYQEHWGHDTIKVIQSKYLFLWCQGSIRQKQILKKSLLFFPEEALMNRCIFFLRTVEI